MVNFAPWEDPQPRPTASPSVGNYESERIRTLSYQVAQAMPVEEQWIDSPQGFQPQGMADVYVGDPVWDGSMIGEPCQQPWFWQTLPDGLIYHSYWAGVREPPPALDALVADLRAALVEAGIAFDPKPFVTHITLVRNARPDFELPVLEPIDWPVRGFVLVRSVTGREGSAYEVIRRWAG